MNHKILLVGVFFALVCSFATETKAQIIGLKELIRVHDMRDTTKIDIFLNPNKWVYMSSELDGKNQVDMWMTEEGQHVVTGIVLNIMNSDPLDMKNNQTVLHLLKLQKHGDLLAEASDLKFKMVKDTQVTSDKRVTYYESKEYLLVVTVDKKSELPYKFAISKFRD